MKGRSVDIESNNAVALPSSPAQEQRYSNESFSVENVGESRRHSNEEDEVDSTRKQKKPRKNDDKNDEDRSQWKKKLKKLLKSESRCEDVTADVAKKRQTPECQASPLNDKTPSDSQRGWTYNPSLKVCKHVPYLRAGLKLLLVCSFKKLDRFTNMTKTTNKQISFFWEFYKKFFISKQVVL
jgi:hypothetical protein